MLMVKKLANKIICRALVLCVCCMSGAMLAAEDGVVPVEAIVVNDSRDSFVGSTESIKWDIVGTFTGITWIGVNSWNWGSSSFRFQSEGWFEESTKSGGMDKLGHAFSAYTLTNAFSERMIAEGVDSDHAAADAAILAQTLTLYIEVFDGMSNKHGFAYEDAVFNFLGGGLAYLRQRYPEIKNAVDYRMEYEESGYEGFDPLADYSGQKYLLAFKLGQGDTFLRYVELQAGYYAVGFSQTEAVDGVQRQRFGFVGIGINLSELILGAPAKSDGPGKKLGRFFFEHIQLPETSIRDEQRI